MGFLRVKTIKGHEYIYWCKRVRSRKKHGGTGKVKSPDILIGNSVVRGKYLPFYLHTGDVPLQEYAKAAITHILGENWSVVADGMELKAIDVATAEINWHVTPKVCLRSKDKLCDLRRQSWRQARQELQEYLKAILKKSKLVRGDIELAAFYLAKYEHWVKEAQRYRDKLNEYRKNPTKTWTEWKSVKDSETGQWRRQEVNYYWKKDADIILDENIAACDKNALWFWDEYHEVLNQVIDYVPRQRQGNFKHGALSQIEKLAKDARWVERYEEQRSKRESD